MKRSKMIEYIKDEIREVIGGLKFSNEKMDTYFFKRSKDLLDMIEGFGMEPPPVQQTFWDRSMGDFAMINEWEPEDDGK